MNKYIFDLDWTLYSEMDISFINTVDFYDSFKEKLYLNKLLKKLTGQKYIFSNGNREHVRHVVNKMELNPIFKESDIAYSELYDNKLKPDIYAYKYVINKFKINDNDSVFFFEDSIENLETAKKLGWITILIGSINDNKPSYVDYHFSNVEIAILFIIYNKSISL